MRNKLRTIALVVAFTMPIVAGEACADFGTFMRGSDYVPATIDRYGVIQPCAGDHPYPGIADDNGAPICRAALW